MINDERISSGSASRILGISQEAVRRMVKRGALMPCDETPLGRLFSRREVERLRDERAKSKK